MAAYAQRRRRQGSSLSSFLAWAGIVLLLLAGGGGYLLYQSVEVGDVKKPLIANQLDTGKTASLELTNTAPAAPASIAPGQFVGPSLGTKAQVELLAAKCAKF
jgi:hypothetical protein